MSEHNFPLPNIVKDSPTWPCWIHHLWIMTGYHDDERIYAETWLVPYRRRKKRTVFHYTCARCGSTKSVAEPWWMADKEPV
jgi:hypothetical protein